MGSASLAGGSDGRAAVLPRRPLLLAPFLLAVLGLATTLPLDHAIVAATAGGVLVVLSAIDIERHVIPNRIVLPATGLILLEQLLLFPGRVPECLIAALLAAIVFAAPQLLGRAWMGMGDVKLVLLLGVTLGWGVVGAVLLAFLCVLPVSVAILIRKGLQARTSMIPFGPFLALGAMIVLFVPNLLGLSPA